MILVYTNSAERAVLIATCLGGVSINTSLKIDYENYHLYRESLIDVIQKGGYVTVTFRGTEYFFIYSDGLPTQPLKISEYDLSEMPESITDIIPFLPDKLLSKPTEDFLSRKKIYLDLVNKANYIINAASDDIAGDLAFSQVMTELEIQKEFYRARPAALTPTMVIQAFNTLDTSMKTSISMAARAREKLDWLVSRNASLLLSGVNFEKKDRMMTGRLEGAILSMVVERERLAQYHTHMPLYGLHLKFQNGAVYEVSTKMDMASTQKMASLLERKTVTVTDVQDKTISDPTRLLNLYSLQARVSQMGIPLDKIVSGTNWLFENGFITWPTCIDDMPWAAKPLVAAALWTATQSQVLPENHSVFSLRPSDLDGPAKWDKTTPAYGRTGVLLTEKILYNEDCPPPEAVAVYDVIADSLNDFLRGIKLVNLSRASILLGTKEFTIVRKISETCFDGNPLPFQPSIKKGQELMVISAEPVLESSVSPITEAEVIDILGDLLRDAGSNQIDIISSAVMNLLSWGQITRSPDNSLHSTDEGKLAYKYIRGTTLADLSESISWDMRFLQLSQDPSLFNNVKGGMDAYVTDICEELFMKAESIASYQGLSIDDVPCPVCGSPIVFDDGGSCACSNEMCKFKIPSVINGHSITQSDIGNLLTKGITPLITDFVSSRGQYSARLKLEKGVVTRTFSPPYNCPKCNGPLGEYRWGLKCKNERCGFSINTTICGCHLEDNDIESLFSGKESRLFQMTSKAGKSFSAKLRLDEHGEIKFNFPNRNN